MKLEVSGQPLHTRSLSITSRQREGGRHGLQASIIDLRKRGFVPVAGMMQASGTIHQMHLEGVLDPRSRTLERFEGAIQTPAFEPSEFTRGECCRDPLPRLRALEGQRVDDGFVARLRSVFGGPLGCSHLLFLSQIAASGLSTALDWEERQPAQRTERRDDERIFHRAVEIDGFELADERVQVFCQLSDFHFRAAPPVAAPMQHYGAQVEVRALVTIDLAKGVVIEDAQACERRRDFDEIEHADWCDRSAEVTGLAGQSVMAGISRRLLELFGEAPADRPFLDALLSVAPGFVQCVASLSERWTLKAKQVPTLMGVHGRADSCYMWRDGGVLHEISEAEREQGHVSPSLGGAPPTRS